MENFKELYPKVEKHINESSRLDVNPSTKDLFDQYYADKEFIESEAPEIVTSLQEFLAVWNKQIEANTKAAEKPKTEKPKETPKPKAEKPAKKEKKEAEPFTGEYVTEIAPAITILKSYLNMNGKTVEYKQLVSLRKRMNEAIITGKLDASGTLRDIFMRCYASIDIDGMKPSQQIKMELSHPDKIKEVVDGEKLYTAVELVKKYQNLVARHSRGEKDLNDTTAAKQIRKLLASLGDNHSPVVETIRQNMATFALKPLTLTANDVKAQLGLSGGLGSIPVLALKIIAEILGEYWDKLKAKFHKSGTDGLGDNNVVSAAEIDTMSFETVKLPKKYNQLLGNVSKGASIMVYGKPGSGKSSFAIDLAKEFAAQGDKVLIVSKEEGVNQTMQEKLRRYNATSPNIFVADDQLDDYSGYDLVIFDSVQSLQLEPSDIENNISAIDAMKVYIFQVTKEGMFRGANEFMHLVDCVVTASNGTVTTEGCKNRFGGCGTIKVY